MDVNLHRLVWTGQGGKRGGLRRKIATDRECDDSLCAQEPTPPLLLVKCNSAHTLDHCLAQGVRARKPNDDLHRLLVHVITCSDLSRLVRYLDLHSFVVVIILRRRFDPFIHSIEFVRNNVRRDIFLCPRLNHGCLTARVVDPPGFRERR